MAGRNVEKMAQMEYDRLIKAKEHFQLDIQMADSAIDEIMDKPYYPKQDKDIDYYIDLRNDAEHYLNRTEEDIADLLNRFSYCIDVDGEV
jgi:hypothetical protein